MYSKQKKTRSQELYWSHGQSGGMKLFKKASVTLIHQFFSVLNFYMLNFVFEKIGRNEPNPIRLYQ